MIGHGKRGDEKVFLEVDPRAKGQRLGMSYPREAMFARIEENVKIRCSIRDDGSVSRVAVLSGHPVLARSAKKNAERWTFKNVSERIKAVGGAAIVTYTFQLKGSCDSRL
jgi:TonB family protein